MVKNRRKMKISTLEINQFGRFENQKIVFPDTSFVIVYGENEAGKSTLMNFMLNTLFGYPQKNALARWLRNSEESRLGGSLTFFGDGGQLFRLERMYKEKDNPQLFAGSSGMGDVSTLLHGVDRLLYQSVFCFDLEGLRGVENMQPSDLNDFLLGAGMIGSRELAQAEQVLEKKCGALFKKGGRNPEINRILNELDKLRTEMKNREKKLDTFRQLQEQIERLNEKVSKLNQEKEGAQKQYQEWTAFSAVRPVIASFRALEDEIGRMGPVAYFPENGRTRYDDWRRQIAAAENDAADLDEHLRQLDESVGAIHVDDSWFSEEGNLATLFRAAVKDEQNLREIDLLEDDQRKEQTEYARVLKNLGTDWNADKINLASVEIAFKHQLQEKTGLLRQSAAFRLDASRDLAGQKEKIAQLDHHVEEIKNRHLSEAKVNRRLSTHGRSGRGGPAGNTPSVSIVIVLALFVMAGFAAASYFLFAPAVAVLTLLFGLLLSGLFFFFSKHSVPGGSPSSFPSEMEQAADNRYEAELNLTNEQLAGERKAYEKKLEEFESLKRKLIDEERQFKEWLAANGYMIERPEWAADSVRLVDEARNILNRIEALETRIRARRSEHEQFEAERKRLSEVLHVSGGDAAFLEKRYNMEKEKQRQVHDLRKQRDIYLKQSEILEKKLNRFREERGRLLDLAGTVSEEQFFESAGRFERYQRLKEKRDERQMQIRELAGKEETLNRFFHDFDEGRWDGSTGEALKERLSALEKEISADQELSIKEQSECRSMEENISYRDALDHYHSLLTEVNRKAREWTVYRMAEWAISKAKDQYRMQRMPKVLNEAQHFFERVTGGTYVSLKLNDGDGFIAERRDGRTFLASELSRGTAEQLYLSLRLALMEAFDGGERLPLIIDEGFVNFDHARAGRVYSLLEKASERRQVILFTCHESAYLRNHPSAALFLSKGNGQTVQ